MVQDCVTGNPRVTSDTGFDLAEDFSLRNSEKDQLLVIPVNDDRTDKSSVAEPFILKELQLPPQATTSLKFTNVQLPACFSRVPLGEQITSDLEVWDSAENKKRLSFIWTHADGFKSSKVKTATQAWIVTITGPEGSTIKEPYLGGLRVEFNSFGNPVGFNTQVDCDDYSILPNLEINWGDNSAEANIKLDFGAIDSRTGIVSAGDTYRFGGMTMDGCDFCRYKGVRFDEDGYGIVKYEKGREKICCRLPRFWYQ